MQEPCQLCEGEEARHTDRFYMRLCDRCWDLWKWNVWHEGITPVRVKE